MYSTTRLNKGRSTKLAVIGLLSISFFLSLAEVSAQQNPCRGKNLPPSTTNTTNGLVPKVLLKKCTVYCKYPVKSPGHDEGDIHDITERLSVNGNVIDERLVNAVKNKCTNDYNGEVVSGVECD